MAYNNLPICTINDAFVTLMAQINEILRHGGDNNFHLPHTKKQQHERKMSASVRTIKANVPTFVQTKASQPNFVFDNSNVDSNEKTIDKKNERGNTITNNNKDNEKTRRVLWNYHLKIVKKI